MATLTTFPKDLSRESFLEAPAIESDGEAGRWARVRPVVQRLLIGYAVLTVVLLGIGLLLTHALSGSVGHWDEHVNEQLARHRTSGWNAMTSVATSSMNTLPVIAVAALLSGLLVARHRVREAAFLVTALVVEITVFLSVTFVVARPRPDVPRLNATPSTSSFPSGHTAAATVLLVGSALIVLCCTTNLGLRILSAEAAFALAGFVGFARVYRGLHHPTDVVFGALFGLACLAVAASAVRAMRVRAPNATDSSARSRQGDDEDRDVVLQGNVREHRLG